MLCGNQLPSIRYRYQKIQKSKDVTEETSITLTKSTQEQLAHSNKRVRNKLTISTILVSLFQLRKVLKERSCQSMAAQEYIIMQQNSSWN